MIKGLINFILIVVLLILISTVLKILHLPFQEVFVVASICALIVYLVVLLYKNNKRPG